MPSGRWLLCGARVCANRKRCGQRRKNCYRNPFCPLLSQYLLRLHSGTRFRFLRHGVNVRIDEREMKTIQYRVEIAYICFSRLRLPSQHEH